MLHNKVPNQDNSEIIDPTLNQKAPSTETPQQSLKRPAPSEITPDANKKIKSDDSYELDGHQYEVIQPLASKSVAGNKGDIKRSVLLCYKKNSKDLFVLKIHEPLDSSESAYLASIQNEININSTIGLHVASLNNIENERKYMTLEKFIPGKNLFNVMKADKQKNVSDYPLVSKIDIAVKIIEQLIHLHGLKILHRDIKLENIIYDVKTGLVNFIDYELSLQVGEDLKGIADFKFTPGLIPPELQTTILEDGSGYCYSNKSDIYLLGLTLGEWFGVSNQLSNTSRSTHSLFQPKEPSLELEKIIPILKAMLEDKPEERAPLSVTLSQLNGLKESLSFQKESKSDNNTKILMN